MHFIFDIWNYQYVSTVFTNIVYLTSVAGAVLGDVIGLARIVCVNKNGSECHCG